MSGMSGESGAAAPHDLVETMRFDPYEGLINLDLHIERLREAAGRLGRSCDRHALRNELQSATFLLRQAGQVRLVLGGDGALAIESGPLPAPPALPATVALVDEDAEVMLRTTRRDRQERLRAAAGSFEILFVRADGSIGQGSFTTPFVEEGGVLLTPPLRPGQAGGVLRQALIAEGRAREARLTPDALGDGFLIGNMPLGLIAARLVDSHATTRV